MALLPGINFKWITKVDEFRSRADKLKHEALRTYDEIGKETLITFPKIAQTLANFEMKFESEFALLTLYRSVHPDPVFRNASTEADQILSDLKIDLSMRKDIFDKLVRLEETVDRSGENLTKQARKYLSDKIRDGRHIGLHCSDDIRNELMLINKQLGQLRIEFENNLSEENRVLEFSETQLEGCPAAFISSLKRGEQGPDTRRVNLKYPHYVSVMKNAVWPETRRAMEFAFNTRCKLENGPILEKMIKLRAKKAKLLNYDTYADYVLSMRMAKNANVVKNFLLELKDKVKPLLDRELSTYLVYKEKLCSRLGIEFSGHLDAWDLIFYMNQYEQDRFLVDHENLRQYFPIEKVKRGLFNIYEQLLGLKFKPVAMDSWYPNVEMYSVTDSTADGTLLGYFMLDLYPRDGKYGHARVFVLQFEGLDVSDKAESVRQIPVVAVVTNFTKSKKNEMPLLEHREVVTFFHEFGHVMHVICSRVDFAIFSMCFMDPDFLECPSQMLENWCWNEEGLQQMSGHHKTGVPLPDEVINNLLRSRVANAGVINTKQICLSNLDQTLHSDPDSDPVAVYEQLYHSYLAISVTKGTNMPATFIHMAHLYDAQYYAYLWSKVFAADMFVTRFLKEGRLNRDTGRDYRELILKPGGSGEPSEMLREFLGREPNQDAFLGLIGLG